MKISPVETEAGASEPPSKSFKKPADLQADLVKNWNLTPNQIDEMIREAKLNGTASCPVQERRQRSTLGVKDKAEGMGRKTGGRNTSDKISKPRKRGGVAG